MDREKFIMNLDNFWYRYKIPVLVGLILVAGVFYSIITSEGSKNAALNVIIVGNSVEQAEKTSLQESATKALLSKNTDSIIKHDFWLANGLASGKYAELQGKFMAMVSGGNVDIVIMDTDAFHLYAEMGTFFKLQSLEVEFLNEDEYVTAEGKYDNEKHAYGIQMEDNQRLKQAGFNTDDNVLAVIANTENPGLSSEWINWILEQ